MQKDKLRVGLLLDGTEVAAWACRMIEVIRQSDYAGISLVVQVNGAPREPSSPVSGMADPVSSPAPWSAAVRKLLAATERFLVGKPGQLPNAFAGVDVKELTTGIDVVKMRPRRHQGSDLIEGDDLAHIRARNIDVFICLGSQRPPGEIMRCARHGTWSCRLGSGKVNAGEVSGYREVIESRPITESMVEILTEDPNNEKVICRSFSSTNDMSLEDNRNGVQWKALHLIPRKLKELHEVGAETFFIRANEESVRLQSDEGRAPKTLTNSEWGVLLWRKLLQKIERKWTDLFYFRQWFLLCDFQHTVSHDFRHFKKLIPPKDRFWADPFVVARNDKYFVFIEEFLFARQRGHISLVVIDRDGTHEPSVRVLETPYHLSYPFIFEFDDDLYLIPESFENRTVELYRCTAFPLKWEFQRNLMEDCWMVDTTLLQWQGKWWMFAGRIETAGASPSDELYIYSSDSPISDKWTPHRRNPVVSDVRTARPAGRLFVRNGRLFRPSQNSSRHYGYGFNICEITKLTETEYEERIVSRVEPMWDKNVVSTHTINFEGGLTIIDGQLWRRR